MSCLEPFRVIRTDFVGARVVAPYLKMTKKLFWTNQPNDQPCFQVFLLLLKWDPIKAFGQKEEDCFCRVYTEILWLLVFSYILKNFQLTLIFELHLENKLQLQSCLFHFKNLTNFFLKRPISQFQNYILCVFRVKIICPKQESTINVIIVKIAFLWL